MRELNITSSEENDTLKIQISGSINEAFLQKTVRIPPGKKVVIDFEDVASINSLGIRHWIQWIRTYPTAKFSFVHCPQCVIDQMNVVSDFIPSVCTVESFYVPYFSEQTGEEKAILYKYQEDYTETNPPAIKEVKDSQGNEMSIDIFPKKYFRFLEPRKKKLAI